MGILKRESYCFQFTTGCRYSDIVTDAIALVTYYKFQTVYIVARKMDKLYIQNISADGCVGDILDETLVSRPWSGIAFKGNTIVIRDGGGGELILLIEELFNSNSDAYKILEKCIYYSTIHAWEEIRLKNNIVSELRSKLFNRIVDIEMNHLQTAVMNSIDINDATKEEYKADVLLRSAQHTGCDVASVQAAANLLREYSVDTSGVIGEKSIDAFMAYQKEQFNHSLYDYDVLIAYSVNGYIIQIVCMDGNLYSRKRSNSSNWSEWMTMTPDPYMFMSADGKSIFIFNNNYYIYIPYIGDYFYTFDVDTINTTGFYLLKGGILDDFRRRIYPISNNAY